MTILDEIFAHKREEVARQRAAEPLADVQARADACPPALDFVAALRAPALRERRHAAYPALIAEVKHASPSRGLLVADFDPLRLAHDYAQNGAAALSVLTDERYFGGSLEHLSAIVDERDQSAGPHLPVLRKDFICDPYQLYQARAAGADAVLLIAAHLPPTQLAELQALALELGMAALVEVHSAAELEAALICEPRLIGINNRDLRDFTVSLDVTARLRPLVPQGVTVVAESGIHTPADALRLAALGADAMLVGEALATAADVPAAVRRLAGVAAAGAATTETAEVDHAH
jgi:indole-3-glycerol phosphate synthase